MNADQARELQKSSIESIDFLLEKINKKITIACKEGKSLINYELTVEERINSDVIIRLSEWGYKVRSFNSNNIIAISWSE